jgi:hypothetical protein
MFPVALHLNNGNWVVKGFVLLAVKKTDYFWVPVFPSMSRQERRLQPTHVVTLSF